MKKIAQCAVTFFLWISLCTPEKCPNDCVCKHLQMECKVIPDIIQDNVVSVTVNELKLTNKSYFTGAGWDSVTNLSLFSDLSVLFHEQRRVLRSSEFEPLRLLEYLQISYTSIQEIEENAFRGLQRLKVLDLSHNVYLNLGNVIKGLNGTDILPNLRELYLSNMTRSSSLKTGEFVINEDFYKVIENKPLEVLDISYTVEADFKYSPGFETAFANLIKLNLSGAGTAAFSFQTCMMDLKNGSSFNRLRVIDVSDTLKSDNGLWLMDEVPFNDITYNKPPVLEELYANNYLRNQSKLSVITNETHVCLLSEFLNNTNSVCAKEWFNYLEKLVLSENSLESIDPKLFVAVKNLTYLDVAKNRLGNLIAEEYSAWFLFITLSRLETVVASYNGITYIPADAFEYASKLTILDLSHNSLSAITFKTEYLVSLNKLYLNSNAIMYLDSPSINKLDSLFSSSVDNGLTYTSNVTLTLHDNPFVCTCNSVEFIKWLLLRYMHNVLLSCTLNSKTVTIDKIALSKSEYLCKETLVVVASCTTAGIVFVVCSLVLYLMIQKRRQQRYLAQVNRVVEAFAKKVNNKMDIKPAVFLSFSSEDYEIVFENILPQLDTGLKKVLNTDLRCVATGADEFRPGFPVATEIIHAIEACEVVVFFITKSFCKNKWCAYETVVANTDHKPIVLMLWEPIDRKIMPKHIRKCYEEYTRVQWNIENGEQVMTPKWNVLCESIVKLMGDQETKF